jgi:hypothetical protein
MDSDPILLRDENDDMWVIRVESNGKVQEYRCGSELQARALAALLLTPHEQPASAAN